MTAISCRQARECAISIVIPVYNQWQALGSCLESLSTQSDAPSFEVIVVDDGSSHPQDLTTVPIALRLLQLRQPHGGVSVARNYGAQHANGDVVLFVDSDCRLDANCLRALWNRVNTHASDYVFQLRIVGGGPGLVGETENLDLSTIQRHMLLADGRICWLNTAGFAIRRSRVDVTRGLFEPRALRGQDKLLLAELRLRNEYPRYIPDCVVQHVVRLSLLKYLTKALRTAYVESATDRIIVSRAGTVGSSNTKRFAILISLWRASHRQPSGALAVGVVIMKRLLKVIGRMAYSSSGPLQSFRTCMRGISTTPSGVEPSSEEIGRWGSG